jgi:hypothetical protein
MSCHRIITICIAGPLLMLVGLWTSPAQGQLRGLWRLQETSGTTAVDTSSLSNNGTYTNGVSLASSTAVPSDGAIAATFDGVNDYVAIPNEANYDLTGAMTVACWIKVSSFTKNFQAIVTKGNTAWRLAREGTTNTVQFACTGLSTFKVVSVSSVNDGQWHHIAGVYTGSALQIYIDGALDNSVATSGTISTNNYAMEIGRNAEATGREFHGSIYGAMLYNGALDGASIQAIYEWDGLLAHWKLNQTSGTVATDSSLSTNHGTYTNGVVLGSTGPYPGAGSDAANFDGVNDYVATANEYLYDLSGPLSVAAWIKVDTFTKQWQAIVTKGDTAWRLLRDDTNNGVTFACTGLSTLRVASVASVNDGAWHHVVGVYTGSQLQMYIDGVLDNSVASTGAISRNGYSVQIGRNAEVASKEFDGRIFDVRIYSVALSAADVAELYGAIGVWKLNETSGTTAADSSVFAKNGTLSGSANWSTDCGGLGVFDFNGSSNYISTTNASHLQPTSAVTIAAWVKGNSWGAGTDVDMILRKGEANPNNYALAISDGRVELLLDGSDGSGIRGNTVLSAGQWYHVAAVWDGSTVRLFVNGVLDNTPPSRTGTIGADTRPLYIGGRSGADFFDGMIRDVRIYNRAVYDSEIQKLAGLLGHWMFDEGSGTTAADSSGQGLNATLSGGAGWTTTCAGDTAMSTNGTGGIAQTNGPFTPPDAGTVAFWMRSSGAPATTARIFGLGGDWEVRQLTDGRVIVDLCGDGSTTIGTVTPLSVVNRWYHFVATFDSANDTYAIYVDGQLELSGTNPVAMSQQAANILSFGTRTGSTEYWQGALRDFRVYSRRLCPSEIATLYGSVGCWKLDQTVGTTATDSSGAGHNGTYVNGVTLGGSGPKSGLVAAQFDGANDYVSLPADSSDFSRGLTVSVWARPTAAGNNGWGWDRFIDWGNGQDQYNIFFSRNGTTNTLELAIHGGTLDAPSASAKRYVRCTNTLELNAWHHYAATINSAGTAKLYKDGAELSITSGSSGYPNIGLPVNVTRTNNYIARSNWPADAYYQGKMWDLRVYNRPLCPSEIQTLYSAGVFEGVKIIKWFELQ